jgi:hypothetical protein
MDSLGSKFFPGQRKRLTLNDYAQLEANDEQRSKRKKLTVSMEIDGTNNLAGMPEWVHEAYVYIAKDGNYAKRVQYSDETAMKGITFTIYSTPEGQQCFSPLTRCVLKKLQMVRKGKEDKARFHLQFVIYTPDTLDLHQWLDDHFAKEFWASFDQGQMELELQKGDVVELVADGGDDDDDYEDDDIDPEDEDEDENDETEVQEVTVHEPNYLGKEHDDSFRSTPLVSAAARNKRNSAVTARR